MMRWYDAVMRTTIDLPPGLKSRLQDVADMRNESMSAVVTTLLLERLNQMEGLPSRLERNPVTGLLNVKSDGHVYTMKEIADLLDEDE